LELAYVVRHVRRGAHASRGRAAYLGCSSSGWQHITGSVTVSNDRGERRDALEELAQQIASRAGWTIAGLNTRR
jgi:hypothetical protein